MESAGTTPAFAVHAPNLAELAGAAGPFLTVYLATEGDIDNAAQRNELRWRQLRDELQGTGAEEHLLAAVDALVPEAHHVRALLVRGGDRVGHVARRAHRRGPQA